MNKNTLRYKIIKWWVCSKLPDVHILKYYNNKTSLLGFFKFFLLHPLKRRFAKYYLLFLKRTSKVKVIAITGSSGKTTTKEMLTSVLKLDGSVVSTYKNIDPIYNIPETILRTKINTKYLILEMGVEYPDEMDFYLWLAKPDISIITNINPTHLEFFKNIDGVFKEKIKIFSDNKNSILFFNNDDNYLKGKLKIIPESMVGYGKGTNIYASNIHKSNMNSIFTLNIDKSKISVQLPVYGIPFISNSLVAAAVSNYLGINLKIIKQGLENYELPEHRMNIFKESNGAIIVDDTYNNNPKAAEETLKSVKQLANGKKVGIVIGDMLELGSESIKFHKQLGKLIGQMSPVFLIYIGDFSNNVINEALRCDKNIKTYTAKTTKEAYQLLLKHLNRDKIILVKGSRSLALDEIIDKLSK